MTYYVKEINDYNEMNIKDFKNVHKMITFFIDRMESNSTIYVSIEDGNNVLFSVDFHEYEHDYKPILYLLSAHQNLSHKNYDAVVEKWGIPKLAYLHDNGNKHSYIQKIILNKLSGK